jgi:peptidoglycan hydrolase CwlO-like protein
MLKKYITKILGILSLTLIFFGVLNYNYYQAAQADTLCPSYMDPDSVECLDYLRDKLGEIQQEQGEIQNQLKEEEYQQLSLYEKISYITTQVTETEKVIKALEVEIAANDVQIKLLEDDIQETEDYVSLMKQEINQLESSVYKRVTESYKYSFVGPLELILDSKGLGSVLRKTKYLAVTRTQDKESLQEFSDKVEELNIQEEELEKQQAELQIVRNSQEEEKTELVDERKNLADQKAEKDRLLAQSEAKEIQLLNAYQKNIERVSALDKAIIQYINAHGDEMADYGWVNAGTWIGNMGNTGCSDGAHLHFGLNSGHKYDWWGYFYSDVNLFSSGYLTKGSNSFLYWSQDDWWSPFVHAGSLRLPIGGQYIIMTQDEHQGNAIDLVSYSQNTWGYKNDGAPIYAIMEGQLYKGTESVCGGKYAEIHHPNGMVSVYLHLQ